MMIHGIARRKPVVSGFRQSFAAVCAMAVLVAVTFSFAVTGSYPGANPSLSQIDSMWRVMDGPKARPAMVVYNKMVGGNTPTSLDTLCLMRFGMAGSTTATIKNLRRYVQWAGVKNWGVSSGYRISKDGTKIAMQNGTDVSVCDSSGLNPRVIWLGSLAMDQIALSWDDSLNMLGGLIRRVVYGARASTSDFFVLRTVVNADNSAGATDTLWRHSWGLDPAFGASAQQYASINKVGNFLCFDMPVSVNLPVVVNLRTKTAATPTGTGDGCQVRMLQDGLGTVSYHEVTHLTHATVWRPTVWPAGAVLGYVPCPNGQQTGCSDCGNNMFNWCETDTNYLAQAGDNDIRGSPGCYVQGFIRKGKFGTPPRMMYLGNYTAFPCLWVDISVTGTINERVKSRANARVSIRLTASELTLVNADGRAIDDAVLINVSGAVVARGQKTAPCRLRFAIASLPAGMYILSWRSADGNEARFIAIAR